MQKNSEAMVSGVKKGNDEIVNDTKETFNELNNITGEGAEKTKTQLDKWKDYVSTNLDTVGKKFMFFAEASMQAIKTAFQGISDISAQHYENEFAKLELAHETEKEQLTLKYEEDQAALDSQYENALISEADYNARSTALRQLYENDLAAIDKESNKKKNDLAKKQFKANKAFSIANIWINYATAVMGFWSAFASMGIAGIVLGAIMTTLLTGVAIAQTAVVSRQKFVPQYAGGTESHAGGPAIINEVGPELVTMPTGSRVMTANATREFFNTEGMGKSVNVNVNNPVVRNENDINKIANSVSEILGRKMRLGYV
jgi:hypothetical protein